MKLALDNAPSGESLFDSIKQDMNSINPQYKYDVYKGYNPTNPDTPKLVTLNKYDAVSGIYQPSKLDSNIIEKMFQNVDAVNPYLLAKVSPMITLKVYYEFVRGEMVIFMSNVMVLWFDIISWNAMQFNIDVDVDVDIYVIRMCYDVI